MKALNVFLLLSTVAVSACDNITVEDERSQQEMMKKIQYDNPKLQSFFDDDPYAFFEDASFFDSEMAAGQNKERIKEIVAAENVTFDAFRDKALEKTIFDSLFSREEPSEDSYPRLKRGHHYSWRTLAGKEYKVLVRKKEGTDVEETLLDENHIVQEKGYAFYATGGISISKNNLFAYSYDNEGNETYKIVVQDLNTGNFLSDTIDGTSGSVFWHPYQQGLFYHKQDNHVTRKLYYHALGTDAADDVLIFNEENLSKSISASLTGDDNFLYVMSGDTENTCAYMWDLRNPGFEKQTVIPESLAAREAHISSYGDYVYLSTNQDPYINHRVYRIHKNNLSDFSRWEMIIDSEPNRLLCDFEVYRNHLVAVFRAHASSEMFVYPLNDFSKGTQIKLSDEPCDLSIDFEEADRDWMRFSYTTALLPEQKHTYDFATGAMSQVYQKSVPNYHPSQYRTERIVVKTHDGKDLPVSLLYRADHDPMNAPLWVYAYGSYGIAMEPGFRRVDIEIADRGFTYAVVHARGGTDCGFEWYLDGKLDKKVNTFKDVISATQALHQRFEIDSPGKVIVNGRSAGGLVIGYCANERPDLFGVVIGEVAYVDVIKDMLNTNIPLTMGEWREWGNPQIPEQFEWLAEYDPVYNVKPHAYGDILLTTGLSDPRVPYWEPYKLGWKIREQRTNPDGLTLFQAYDSGGHFGGSGRSARLWMYAATIAFGQKAVATWSTRHGK